jgi:hypothetical protein
MDQINSGVYEFFHCKLVIPAPIFTGAGSALRQGLDARLCGHDGESSPTAILLLLLKKNLGFYATMCHRCGVDGLIVKKRPG